jgi:chromosome segregation ATPase
VREAQKLMRDTMTTVEKRTEVEVRNLRGRLRDVNTTLAALERRYRTLERRVERELNQLSRRVIRGTEVEKRIRQLETELRRLAGLRTSGGKARKAAARKTPVARAKRAAKRTGRKATGAARKTARRGGTRARRPRASAGAGYSSSYISVS